MKNLILIFISGCFIHYVFAQESGVKSDGNAAVTIHVLEMRTENPIVGVELMLYNGKDSIKLVSNSKGEAVYRKMLKHPKLVIYAMHPDYVSKLDSTMRPSAMSPKAMMTKFIRLEKAEK